MLSRELCATSFSDHSVIRGVVNAQEFQEVQQVFAPLQLSRSVLYLRALSTPLNWRQGTVSSCKLSRYPLRPLDSFAEMTGASMDHCPKQGRGMVDTGQCGASISGKSAAEVLLCTAEQVVVLSKVDGEKKLYAAGSPLWRQLFETLRMIGMTDADFRNMLLISGPALWVLLSNSVKKVVNVLHAPLHWRISKDYQKGLTWDASTFSVLSVGTAIFWIRYGRTFHSGQHNRTATSVEPGGNTFNILAKGASLGLGLVAAAGTLWFAIRHHLNHNRVYRDYHVILEHVFKFLSASGGAAATAASLPTCHLEIAIATRCQELGLSSRSVDEGLNLPKLSGSAALIHEDTRKDIVLRAKLLEKISGMRSLLENYLTTQDAQEADD